MAFLFSPEKVLSLEINNFHNNNKGVQAPMLPSAIWGGTEGKDTWTEVPRQGGQVERQGFPGRQATRKFGCQPGLWEGGLHRWEPAQKTTTQGQRMFHSSKDINQLASVHDTG